MVQLIRVEPRVLVYYCRSLVRQLDLGTQRSTAVAPASVSQWSVSDVLITRCKASKLGISRALAGEWVQLIRVEPRVLVYYCRSLVRQLDLGAQRSTAVAPASVSQWSHYRCDFHTRTYYLCDFHTRTLPLRLQFCRIAKTTKYLLPSANSYYVVLGGIFLCLLFPSEEDCELQNRTEKERLSRE
ncbi:MAG TPA: hypothetical protein VIY66_05400 [Candidatus Acidoferrales bacterium]